MTARPLPFSLAGAPWLDAPDTRRLMAALAASGSQPRFVGGCVRNALLGLEVSDIDVATPDPPDVVERLLQDAGIKVVPTGLAHGTVTAIVEGRPFEVTTLRHDVETDGRRAKVAFTADWAGDAARRDFTINAIYADAQGTLHDPVAGLADLAAGRVRFIGDAHQRIAEDHLRILRFFRIHAWYGEGPLDREGLLAVEAARAGVTTLSAERVQKELLRLLEARDPVPVLRQMAAIGVLELLLPEAHDFDRLVRLVAIENNQLFVPPDALLRLAALVLSDALDVAPLAARLRLSGAHRHRLANLVQARERVVSYLSARELRRALYRLGRSTFLDLVRLRWAGDAKTANDVQWRALLAMAETWQAPTLPLSGRDIMAAGVPAGPEVGRVMAEVEEWWIDADFPDDRFSIIERLKAIVQATMR